jgi:hypothetical protein
MGAGPKCIQHEIVNCAACCSDAVEAWATERPSVVLIDEKIYIACSKAEHDHELSVELL